MDERSLAPEQQASFVPTIASTIDEILRAAYFVAASIDAPVVELVSPHQVNVYYPADGSLASVKVEGRPGAWGGLSPHGTPEEEAARNAHYDLMLAAATPPAEDGGLARGQEEEHPVYEVQRQ